MIISVIELGNQSGCSVGLNFHKAGNEIAKPSILCLLKETVGKCVIVSLELSLMDLLLTF